MMTFFVGEPQFHFTPEQWNGTSRQKGITYYAGLLGYPTDDETKRKVELAIDWYRRRKEIESESEPTDEQNRVGIMNDIVGMLAETLGEKIIRDNEMNIRARL